MNVCLYIRTCNSVCVRVCAHVARTNGMLGESVTNAKFCISYYCMAMQKEAERDRSEVSVSRKQIRDLQVIIMM